MLASLKLWLADRLGLLRLNAAVAHLIARDLNLNSALPEGPREIAFFATPSSA